MCLRTSGGGLAFGATRALLRFLGLAACLAHATLSILCPFHVTTKRVTLCRRHPRSLVQNKPASPVGFVLIHPLIADESAPELSIRCEVVGIPLQNLAPRERSLGLESGAGGELRKLNPGIDVTSCGREGIAAALKLGQPGNALLNSFHRRSVDGNSAHGNVHRETVRGLSHEDTLDAAAGFQDDRIGDGNRCTDEEHAKRKESLKQRLRAKVSVNGHGKPPVRRDTIYKVSLKQSLCRLNRGHGWPVTCNDLRNIVTPYAIASPRASLGFASESAVKGSAESRVEAGDADLIAQCLAGDSSAFDPLVERYERRVFAVCYRYTLNREDAKDLTQDTFVRAYRALRSFRGDSAFPTWLHRIAVNACLSYKTSPSQKRPMEELDETATDPRPSVEHDLEASLQKDALRAALERLPEKQRMTVVLKVMEDRTHAEVANLLGSSVGTVKANLFFAIQNLRKHLVPAER